MSFPAKLKVDEKNVASNTHDDGEFIITVSVHRHGNKPITAEEAERALTKTISLMFIQRT
jgi:hypothetical protein